jgi:hypothetical protein
VVQPHQGVASVWGTRRRGPHLLTRITSGVHEHELMSAEADATEAEAVSFVTAIASSADLLILILSWLDPESLARTTSTSAVLRAVIVPLLQQTALLRVCVDIVLPPLRCGGGKAKPLFVQALTGDVLVLSNSADATGARTKASMASIMMIHQTAEHRGEAGMKLLDVLDALCVKRRSFRPTGLAIGHRGSCVVFVDNSPGMPILEQGLASSGRSFSFEVPQFEQRTELARLGSKGSGLSRGEAKRLQTLEEAEARWWHYLDADNPCANEVDQTGETAPSPDQDDEEEGEIEGRLHPPLQFPLGLAIGSRTGRVYVVDSDGHRIYALPPGAAASHGERGGGAAGSPRWTPHVLFAFGDVGPGRVEDPFAIAAHDGKLFVSDSSHHRIVVFDEDGRFVRSIGESVGAHPSVAPRLRAGDVLYRAKPVRMGGAFSKSKRNMQTFWARPTGTCSPVEVVGADGQGFLLRIHDPAGVAVCTGGRLAVAMSGGRVLILSNGALDDDPEAPVFVEQVHVLPKGCSGICSDDRGRLIVANHFGGCLHVLAPLAAPRGPPRPVAVPRITSER